MVSYNSTTRRHNPEDFNVHPEDGGSKVLETLISYHSTARCHNLEDLNVHPEDGGSYVFRIVGILPQHYTASQPRRPRLASAFRNAKCHPLRVQTSARSTTIY
jgi:hypothetical protein